MALTYATNRRTTALGGGLCCALLVLVVMFEYQGRPRGRAEDTIRPFPTAELAALDHDIQRRFGGVVRMNFGWRRVSARTNAHGVYVPGTVEENVHVGALRRQGLDVLFYEMGRNGQLDWPTYHPGADADRMVNWRAPWGSKARGVQKVGKYSFVDGHLGDIQPLDDALIKGPAVITGPANKLPMPLEFSATLSARGLAFTRVNPLRSNPAAVNRHDLPRLVELEGLGKRVLRPLSGNDGQGINQRLARGGWDIVAVPIVATDQKCVTCHLMWEKDPSVVKLNTAFGVAMYVYRPLSEANSPVVTVQSPNAAVASNQQRAQQSTGG